MAESTLLQLCKDARELALKKSQQTHAEASLARIQYELADTKVIRQSAIDTDNLNITEIKGLTYAIRSYEGEAKACVAVGDWKKAKQLHAKAKGCRDKANRIYGEGAL